ncbi:MAG: PAS domain S-box protein [Gemmatimonadales bacterium]|nr:PAS domain S-box protein [Gemmatimonadales bacterium]
MVIRGRIAWKLSAAFVTLIAVVTVVSAYLNNLADRRYAVESAREVSRFNSLTILHSLRDRMMTRDIAAIEERIHNLAEESPVYTDIRLVAHGGEIVAAKGAPVGETLTKEARPCRVCHALPDPVGGLEARSHDQVIELEDGERVVSVITPILNEPTCQTAACHAHDESAAVLGLLQVGFSLSEVDAHISSRNLQTTIGVLLAVGLSTIAIFILTRHLVGKPISALTAGMQRFADNDLNYRLSLARNDEFASLAESFNDMSSKLSKSVSELRSTKDYLEGIIESSADIIITVNPDGLIETFNTGAEAILGYSREEVVGQRIELLFADPREREVAIRRLQHTDHVVNYETHFRTKSGDVREVILTLSRLRDPSGRLYGTFGISKDITREKRLQERLVLSEKLAAVGQALAGIQHRMKNMLNALKGGAYMVRTGLAKDDRDILGGGWAIVQEGIDNLTDMSSHILNYVRDWRPELEQVDIGELVEGTAKIFGRTASDKNVELRTCIPEEVPPVLCDGDLVRSAVLDLLANALDACLDKEYGEGERPAIELRVDTDEGERNVLIGVCDNGSGMSEAVKANVFTPFFSTKKKWGTGLGLALTSRVISAHGGDIQVESARDRGSSFRVSLPVSGLERDKEGMDG